MSNSAAGCGRLSASAGLALAASLLLSAACVSAAAPAYDESSPAYPDSYTEAQKTSQRSGGARIMAQLREAIDAKASGFDIPAGVYRVKGTFNWDNVKDFTLTARGVEFIVENSPTADFMALNGCERLTLRGPMVIDCDPMVFSQGRILAYDAAAKALTVRVHAGYRTALKPARFQLFGADGGWLPQTMQDFSAPAMVDAQTVRITVPGAKESADLYKPGNLIAFEGPGTAFACRRSNYAFEDITVYGGYNMFAWEDQARGPNLYLRCKMIRRPGSNRLIGGAGPQQNYVAGGPTYDGCEFAFSWDDNINLLNNIHMVFRQDGPRTVIVKPGSSFTPFAAGDTASFYRFDSFDKAGSARVVAVADIADAAMVADANALARSLQPRDLGGRECVRLTLDRDVSLRPTDYVESSNFRPKDVVIRNSYFHDFMCRTLIQGVRGAVIENNVIERAGLAAIDVRLDSYWWEGPTSEHVVIKGNTIKDSPYSLYGACCSLQMSGAISVGPSTTPGRLIAKDAIFRDFRIEGNHIINSMWSGILAKNIDGLIIKDNIIEAPVNRANPPARDYYGEAPLAGIYVHAVRNAEITGNRMSPSSRCTTIVMIGKYTDAAQVRLSGNTLGTVSARRPAAMAIGPARTIRRTDAGGRRPQDGALRLFPPAGAAAK